MSDLISRQAAIDRLNSIRPVSTEDEYVHGIDVGLAMARVAIKEQPSAEPEPAIPLQWIKAQIEWLKSLDNAFSTLTAEQISAMVNKWKGEQDATA